MPVRFSEGPVSTLTLVGEEQDDPQRRQVRHFNSTNNTFTHSSAKSAEPLDTTICSSVFGRLPCLISFLFFHTINDLCFLCHFCRKKQFTSPLYPHFNNLSSIVKQSFILNHRTNACFSIASGNQINFHQTTCGCFDQISFHVFALVYFPFFEITHISLSLSHISTLVISPRLHIGLFSISIIGILLFFPSIQNLHTSSFRCFIKFHTQFFFINAIFFSIFVTALLLFYNSISILHIILLIASRKNLLEFQSLPRQLALDSFLFHALSLLF
jgi:hypothetical protein